MSTRTKYAVGAVAAAIIVLWILPWWLAIPLLALPVVGYLALDSSQRRRLGRVTRKRLER